MICVDVKFRKGFHLLAGDIVSQAASMVLQPNDSEGGPDNRHVGADQWLYVESGAGEVTIEGEPLAMKAGTLVLIKRGERHTVRATGDTDLHTVSIYVPPAYRTDGNELPAGKSNR